MRRWRLAVVGVGHLGQHHARILAGMPDVELVAVADSRAEQARAVASRFQTRAVGDYRELLDQVDAVSIAVPTTLHREVAGAFLERGIPTMVEKPLARSAAEAEELVRLARSRETLLQVGHIERFNPVLSTLDGLAVRPKYIDADRLSTYTFRSTDIGVVHDLMIHDLDLVLSLIATPVRAVSAVGVSVFGTHEDIANARIEFEDGCVANLTASRVSYQAVRKMRIWSAEAYATLDFHTREGTLVRPSESLRRGEIDLSQVDMTNPSLVKEHLFGTLLRVDRSHAATCEPLALELEDFLNALRTGARPRVNGDDALRAMRLAGQILQSMESHEWEGLPTGPVGPLHVPQPQPVQNGLLRGPVSWRKAGRSSSSAPNPKAS